MAMYGGTIYTKTRSGSLAMNANRQQFSPEVRTVFLSLDGKTCVAEVVTRLGLSAARVERALRTLEADGYVQISRSPEAARGGEAAAEVDLDFTSTVAAPAPSATAPAPMSRPHDPHESDPLGHAPAGGSGDELGSGATAQDSRAADLTSLIGALEARIEAECASAAEARSRAAELDSTLTRAAAELEQARAALSAYGEMHTELTRQLADVQARMHADADELAKGKRDSLELQTRLAHAEATIRRLEERAEEETEARSASAAAFAHEQHAAQQALLARVLELEQALERERQNAYEHALGRAEVESRLESERTEARAAEHEAAVHVSELEAALEKEHGAAYQRALAYADIEAQFAAEHATRCELEQRLSEEGERRESAGAQLAGEARRRTEAGHQLDGEREARRRATNDGAAEQDRAVEQAQRRCGMLEAQLRETLAALRGIEEAAHAQTLLTARLAAHLTGDTREDSTTEQNAA